MHSTEPSLEAFFGDRLLPVAQELGRRGVRFFPLGPDHTAGSWYQGEPPEPDFVAFENDDWSTALRHLWAGQGLHELAELIEPLRELAEAIGPSAYEPSEVSTFIYVMY